MRRRKHRFESRGPTRSRHFFTSARCHVCRPRGPIPVNNDKSILNPSTLVCTENKCYFCLAKRSISSWSNCTKLLSCSPRRIADVRRSTDLMPDTISITMFLRTRYLHALLNTVLRCFEPKGKFNNMPTNFRIDNCN